MNVIINQSNYTISNTRTSAHHLFQLGISEVIFLLELITFDREWALEFLNLFHSLMDLTQTDVQVMLLLLQIWSLFIVQFHLHTGYT